MRLLPLTVSTSVLVKTMPPCSKSCAQILDAYIDLHNEHGFCEGINVKLRLRVVKGCIQDYVCVFFTMSLKIIKKFTFLLSLESLPVKHEFI